MLARVLIVDDHKSMRRAIRNLLQPWVEICGEVADGKQAVERVRDLQPDLVILDLAMPEMNGYLAAMEIRQISPSTKIIFFSVLDGSAGARLFGAEAFVSKSAGAKELLPAVQRLLGS